ncbi:hypothetical protein WMF04_39070 [Sorangium sp. So ce260]|uniref:hypothetical protein n=1 Tax=Sorangium sp. So ce260 TaxID=3133291 RepID=UPI003F6368FD
MVWSSWSVRRVRQAVLLGAVVAGLSLPGGAAAQEAPAPAREESERGEDIAQRRERAALMATHFNDVIKLHSSGKGLPILFGGLGAVGLAGSVAGLASSEDVSTDGPPLIALASGSATMLAGGIAALALPETYRLPTLSTAGLLSQGGLWLGIGLALDEDAGLARMTPIALSAGFYVSGLLSGLNLALSEYTPVSRLRADHALVATPGSRARLSGAQISSIERDLLGTEPAIPNWAIYLPVALGTVAATIPVLDRELPTEERLFSGTLGLLNTAWLVAMMDRDHPVQSYQRDLRRAGLRVAPSGPEGTAGLTVSGKF